MAYVGKQLSELPPRTGPGRKVDEAGAQILYDLTKTAGQTATDGEVYPDTKTARSAANAAKRLLRHRVPEAIAIETRIYPVDGGYGWSVWQALGDATPPATGKKKA